MNGGQYGRVLEAQYTIRRDTSCGLELQLEDKLPVAVIANYDKENDRNTTILELKTHMSTPIHSVIDADGTDATP